MKKILEIQDLTITCQKDRQKIYTIDEISFHLNEGEILGIVGESGCGKTTLVQSIIRILPGVFKIEHGKIFYKNENLLEKSPKELRSFRGKEIGMIFQDPFITLNPIIKIGKQISEALLCHKICSKSEVKKRVIDLLYALKISDPKLAYKSYPHQLSGGMRQRIVIAIAICCSPKIVIADEPTTALDVTTQSQILDLLLDIRKNFKTSILLITHDLSIISKVCDRVLIMYAGKIVEEGYTNRLLSFPKHPYTQMLLESVPTLKSDPITNPLRPIEGSVPVFSSSINCCPFVNRCAKAMNICAAQFPKTFSANHNKVSCWLYDSRNKQKDFDKDQEPQKVLLSLEKDS